MGAIKLRGSTASLSYPNVCMKGNGAVKALQTTRRGLLAAVAVTGIVQGVGTLTTTPFADAATGPMVATTSVNVRPTPSTAKPRIGLLHRGDRIQATGTSGGWTTVQYKGRTAYVASAYLRPAGATRDDVNTTSGAAAGTAYTTANLNIRTGPSIRYRSVTVVPKGTALELTGTTQSGWSQVTWRGEKLWCASRYLSSAAGSSNLPPVTGRGRATARLMIRTTSGRNYQSLEVVPVGTIIDSTGVVENGMAQVIWKGNIRWVNNQYFEPVGASNNPTKPATPTTTTRYATANLNVWAKSTGSSYNGEIPRGSAIEVTGKIANGRAEIVYNGVIKWVTSRYTTATKPSSITSSNSGGQDLNRGFSSGLDKANPFIQRIAQNTWDTFPEIKTQYGWRRDVTPDHPAGRAVDIMIPGYKTAAGRALGKKIAEYYKARYAEFNIHYIIWDQKIWNITRDREGWRPMASRGSDTANHKDHVHITTYDS